MRKYVYPTNQTERVEELIYKYKQSKTGVTRYMVRANKEGICVRNTFATLEEAMIHYNIGCPYCNDKDCMLGENEEPNRETCVKCKARWLDKKVEY